MTRVAVVVVGDIGRSPRMQYHALSLAGHSCEVDLIGYKGTECWPSIAEHPKIKLHTLQPVLEDVHVPKVIRKYYLLCKIYKVLLQMWALWWVLFWSIKRPDYILVQTPPAIPILHLAHLVSWLRWCKLVIDWHNYGYTILNMSKKDHYTVQLYRLYEHIFGHCAYHYFCVSNAMKEDLATNWGIRATVLYDKPSTTLFKAVDFDTRHKFFQGKNFGQRPDPLLNVRQKATAFTEIINRKTNLRSDRPALLVSSSSWTKDEDFDLLLDAMERLDKIIKKAGSALKIRLVVTGKGDLRELYEKKMDNLKLDNILMYTTFLTYPEYATLLGSADVGICLHVSSSGLDLPMKVVDMFGSQLPVCAIHYPALSELVEHEKTGMIFHSSDELAEQVFELLKNFPTETNKLDKMRQKIHKYHHLRTTWATEWESKAQPVFIPPSTTNNE